MTVTRVVFGLCSRRSFVGLAFRIGVRSTEVTVAYAYIRIEVRGSRQSYNESFNMDYAQRQKFARQIALAVVCVAGITALICAQAPEGDEEWELDSTTAEMAESVINVCHCFSSFSSEARGFLSSL